MKHLQRFWSILLLLTLVVGLQQWANAQTNTWTFVGGNSSTSQLGFGIYSGPSQQPGTRNGSCYLTDGNGNAWLFGGSGGGASSIGYLNDLWKFNISTNIWIYIGGSSSVNQRGLYSGPSQQPGARDNSIFWADGNGNFWLFGGNGYGVNNNGYLNDLWKYNTSSNSWTFIGGSSSPYQLGVYSGANQQPGSRLSSTSWADGNGNLWLFGGYGYINGNMDLMNDLWKYNISSSTWTYMGGSSSANQLGIYSGTSQKPGARWESVSWVGGGNLWLFGGSGFGANSAGDLNDLWKYNISSSTWTYMGGSSSANQPGIYSGSSQKPGARSASTSCADGNGNLWLFGGYGNSSSSNLGYLNDLWKYNISSNSWTFIGGSSDFLNQQGAYNSPNLQPGARNQSTSWVDSNGNFWLFGGNGYASNNSTPTSLNDLWKYIPQTNPLPLHLTDFVAAKQRNGSLLSWKVMQEQNIANYTIEHSTGGHYFKSIGVVAGSSASSIHTYYFTDANPLKGTNYYRIKVVEKDGKLSHSEVRLLNFGEKISIAIFPNPAKDKFTLTGVELGMQVQLLNASGQTVATKKATGNTVNFPVNLLPTGRYQVQVIGANDQPLSTAILVKQ